MPVGVSDLAVYGGRARPVPPRARPNLASKFGRASTKLGANLIQAAGVVLPFEIYSVSVLVRC